VYTNWGDCVMERLGVYRPGVGEKEGPLVGRRVYENQEQTRRRSGAHKPGGEREGGAGVPAFGQHPVLPTSFSCFIFRRLSFKLTVVYIFVYIFINKIIFKRLSMNKNHGYH
jgi:hypothetical protein